ncbi:LptA/OstA family protein [Paraburkholderia aspalathi]|uniref:hypothetical protein n=1 Tax=Paraburkholderia aspalathi TaxID=1324617 RepID=UPI0038BE1648
MPHPPIFSSGPDGNVDRAFQDLRSVGFNQFEKIYVLSRGHVTGVESPRQDGRITQVINAQELAAKFMDIGGMRDAIRAEFEPVLRNPNGGRADYRTCLRLLSCETGVEPDNPLEIYSTRSAKSYLHDFANQIGKQLITTLTQLEKQYPDAYRKSSLSLRISLQAPKGWSLLMPSGENVVYQSDSAHEQAADKAAKIAYTKSETKAQMYADEKITPFIKSNDQKKLTLTVRIDKFPDGHPYGEITEA